MKTNRLFIYKCAIKNNNCNRIETWKRSVDIIVCVDWQRVGVWNRYAPNGHISIKQEKFKRQKKRKKWLPLNSLLGLNSNYMKCINGEN